MIVRNITTEPLDDGEAALLTDEPKPAREGLFSRAKKAMTNGVSNTAKKMKNPVAELSKALGPIREALQRWEEIQAAHHARCDTSAYTAYLAKMEAKFADTQSPEDHGKVFLARAVLKERAIIADTGQRDVYQGALELEWIQCPDVREKVKRACEWKIEVAKREVEKVRTTEQSRLGPKYDASESPIVKDYAGKLAAWTGQLENLNTRMVVYDAVMEAQRFLAVVKLLLKDGDSFAGKFVHKDDGDIYELERVDEIENPELAEFERTHHLRSAVAGKSWIGGKADFEKVFKKI